MNVNERAVPQSARDIFTYSYAISEYERLAMQPPRRHEIATATLAKLAGGVKDGDVIVEVGCGTGNSTIVLAESNPRFGQIIGIEPSAGFIEIARYKFGIGRKNIPDRQQIEEGVSEFIETQRERAIKFTDKVNLMIGGAQSPPLESESADKIYCCNVIHWLAFADGDTEGTAIDYLDVSLAEFARVLKSGGQLFFDSTGLQFDLEGREEDELPEDTYHYIDHPFHRLFIRNLNELLIEMGIDADALLDTRKFDRYSNIFNLGVLTSKLAQFGFELIPTEDDKPYEVTPVEQSAQHFLSLISAGKMRYFNKSQLRNLPDETKELLIKNALVKTTAENGELLELPSVGLFVAFAFRKT